MMQRLTTRIARLLLATLAFTVSGCGNTVGTSSEVQIRIENNTLIPLDDIVVVFPDQREEYGDLRAGATSGFRDVAQAYRYAYVEAQAGGVKLVQQPIDYVGESLLTPGRYTYVIHLESGEPTTWLRTDLRRD